MQNRAKSDEFALRNIQISYDASTEEGLFSNRQSIPSYEGGWVGQSQWHFTPWGKKYSCAPCHQNGQSLKRKIVEKIRKKQNRTFYCRYFVLFWRQ